MFDMTKRTGNGQPKEFVRDAEGRFTPGSGGRPRDARSRLQKDFVYALQEDFEKHGAGVIRIVRVEEPAQYLKIIASILPKELEITQNALNGLPDEELEAILNAARSALGTDNEPRNGAKTTLN
jgi:hypothetical protein